MSNRYINLCIKWDVTPKEIDEFIDFIMDEHSVGDWAGNFQVVLAAADLMTRGDVPPAEENYVS